MTTGFVHVIESPSAQDLLDGRTEGRSLCEALSLANIPHCYNLATTLESFREALGARLTNACAQHEAPPILHLSMHGNNEGVALTDGTFLTWNQLRLELAALKNAMAGGLLICMSSCFGGAGCRMAMHEDGDQPFWALVGNTREAMWADAAVAYIAFYHQFFKGKSVQECVDVMRIASGDPNFLYHSGHEVQASWRTYIAEQRAIVREPQFNRGLLSLFADEQPAA